MPDDISLKVSATLDTSEIQAQLDNIKNNKSNKITIGIDAQKVIQQVSEIKKSIQSKTPAKIVLDVLKGQSNTNIDTYIKEVQNKYRASPIKITLGVDQSASAKNIKSALDEMQKDIQKQMQQTVQQAQQTGQQMAQAQQQAQQAAQKATQGMNVGGNASGVPIPTDVAQSTKYVDQLTDAVERYAEAFADADAVVSRWSVNNGTSAAIEFRNALGEVTTVLFQLQELKDEEGKPILGFDDEPLKEWVQVGDRFTKTFRDSSQEIQRTLDQLQRFQAELDSIKTKAFGSKNPLTGDFKDSFETEVDAVQKKIQDLVNDAATNNITLTADKIREIRQELSNLSNTRVTTQAAQSKSIAEQLQLDRSLSEVQKLQNALNELNAKAFERNNQLTDSFARPVEQEVQRIQAMLDSIKSGASVGNLDKMTAEIKEASQALKELDILRKNQQNKQYQARQLSATDITHQIPILRNEVSTLENQLKGMGFGEKFKADIQSLRDMLKTLGKEGGATVQQFNALMRQVTSESKNLASRPHGKGLMESLGISQNQLESIKGIRKVFNLQENTEGIQEYRNKLDELAQAYQRLQAQMESPKMSSARFTNLQRQEKELDQQLAAYQKLAKALNGDAESQKWVAQQEAGMAQMKTKFEEYRQEIEKTIQLTPELQAQMNSLADAMTRDGGVDVANWQIINSQFKELTANIEQYSNTLQGKASKLAISIDTSQIEKARSLVQELRSIKPDYRGTGVLELTTNLGSLVGQYRSVISQLQSTSLTQDQFDALSKKVQELDERLKQAANAAKIFQNGFTNNSALDRAAQKIEDVKLKFQQLKEAYAELIKSNPEIEYQFDQVQESIDGIDPVNVRNVSAEVNTLGKECAAASGQSVGLRGALQDAFGGLGSYLTRFTSAYFIISKAIQAFKSMSNTVKEVNSSIVELQKVTDLTGNSLDSFVNKAYKLGSTLGRTGQDVIDATTTFSRAGYDLQQSIELAQSALVMTNIGVDISSTESAASDMISIMKAFDIQAEDSMAVIDKLYNVANKEPLDFGNITQMLVTAGGTLAQTGTTLEETMGLLTGAFATMRDTSVSNGLIMISQRLRGVREDGEAIEEEGFMPKLKELFASVGISIEDQNGELRSTFDILNDLAAVWDQLSSKQKQYFGEKVAGNRQVKTLNAIMQNWDVVSDTIDKATESEGKALEGNAMYMDSVAGKVTQLKSAIQELATTTISSDFLGFFADAGKSIVNLVTNIGGLIPLLTAISGLIITIKGQQIAKGITAIWGAFKTLFSGMSGGLTAVSGWIGIAITLVSVIAAVVTAINNSKKSFQDFQQATADSKKGLQEEQSKLESLNGELEETKRLIAELEGRDNLSVIEQDELNRLKEKNAELEKEIKLQKILTAAKEKEARNAAVSEYKEYTSNLIDKETSDKFSQRYGIFGGMGMIGTTNEMMLQTAKDNLLGYKSTLLASQKLFREASEDSEEDLFASQKALEIHQNNYDRAAGIIDARINYLDSLIGDLSRVEPDESGYLSESDRAFNAMIDERAELANLRIQAESIGSSLEMNFDLIIQKYPDAVKKVAKEINKDWEIDLSTDKAISDVNDLASALEIVNGMSADGADYRPMGETAIRSYLKDTFMQGEGAGNVDVLSRKVLHGSDMLDKYEEEFQDFQDDVVTYFSSTYTEEIAGVPIAFTLTPIGPDGTVYSQDEIDDYINELIEKSINVENFRVNDEASKGLLLHYTPVVDGDFNAAISQEEAYAQILHLLSSVIDGGAPLQDAIDGIKEIFSAAGLSDVDIDFSKMMSELSSVLNLTGDQIEEIFKQKYYVNVDLDSDGMFNSVSEIGDRLFSSSDSKSTKDISAAAASYKNLTAAITEQQKAGALSYETWSKLTSDSELKGIENYLKLTADGYKLDTDAVYEFIDAQNEEMDLDIAEAIMERQIRIDEYKDAIENTLDPIKDLKEIEEKQEQINAWQNQIDQLKAISLEAHNAAGALQQYRDAAKSQDQDSEHGEGKAIAKVVAERYEEGKVGTDDFKKGLGFLLGENWQEEYKNDVEKAYEDASKISEKYFGSEDKESAQNFAKDLASKGFAKYDEVTGQLTMLQNEATGTAFTIQEMADAFGMSEDAVESLFGLLNSYSLVDQFEFDRPIASAEQSAAATERLEEKIEALKQKQEELNDLEPGTTEYNETAKEVENLKAEVDAASVAVDTLNEAIESGGEVDPFASLDELQTKLSTIQSTIEWLNQNGITPSVELTGQATRLQFLIAALTNNKNPNINVTANDDGASDTLSDVKDGVKELNGDDGKATAVIDGNADEYNTVEGHVEGSIKNLNGDGGKATARFDGKDEGYSGTADVIKEDIKSINGSEGEATAHIKGNVEEYEFAIAPVKTDVNTLDTTPYTIDFTATDNNTIKAVSDAADDAAKSRTITFGVKYEDGKVRKLKEGETPDNYYVDNTYTGKYGETRGYAGLYPYQLKEGGATKSSSYSNYLKKMLGTNGFISEASTESIKLLNEKLEESAKDIQEETQAREDLTEDIVTRPQQDWQENNTLTDAEVTGTPGGGKVPDYLFNRGSSTDTSGMFEDMPIVVDEPIEVPVEVEPKVENESDWQDYWRQLWEEEDPIKVPVDIEPEVENEDAEEEINDQFENMPIVVDEPIEVPVEVNTESIVNSVDDIDSKTIENAGKGVNAVIEAASKNGLTDNVIQSINRLETAYAQLQHTSQDSFIAFDSESIDTTATNLKNAAIEFTDAFAELKANAWIIDIDIDDDTRNALDKISGISKDVEPIIVPVKLEEDGETNLQDNAQDGTTIVKQVDADTSQATTKVDNLEADIVKQETMPVNANVKRSNVDNLIKDIKKQYTMDVNVKYAETNKPEEFAKGTRNAQGGMSLVDEKGAELIEHTSSGTFELGTNNGPRFTHLDKGDVVHTASETKKILSRLGSIGGYFRDGLNQTKSIIGNAFAGGLYDKIRSSVTSVMGKIKLSTTSPKKTNNNKKSSSKKSSKNTSSSKFKDWAEKLFDWAEIKLTRLQELTDEWTRKSQNAIGSILKNENLGNALQNINSQIDATSQAYELYIKQADEVAKQSKLSADIIQKIQDGSIEIGSYDKETQEKIKEYQEWYNKAVDCKKALDDLRDTEKELAGQRMQNIVDEYESRAKLYQKDADIEKAMLGFYKANGKQINGAGVGSQYGDYTKSIEAEQKTIEQIIAERNNLQAELNYLMSSGYIVEGDQNWQKYTEQLKTLDADLYNTQTRVIDLQDAAHQVNLSNMTYQIGDLSDSANKMSSEMDLVATQGSKSLSEMKEYYIDLGQNMLKQNEVLGQQINYYKNLQSELDKNSEKFQEYEKAIRSNENTIISNKKAYEEYLDLIRQTRLDELNYKFDNYGGEIDRLNDMLDLMDITGQTGYANSNVSNAYQGLIKYASYQVGVKSQQREEYQNAMRDMIAQYGPQAADSKKYLDMAANVNELDKSIRSLTKSIEQYKKNIQDIRIETIGNDIDAVADKINKVNDSISLMQASGQYVDADNYKNLIRSSKEQIALLDFQNRLYKEQQQGMDTQSSAYQELEKKIRDNNSEMNSLLITTEGYKDAINQIKFDKYGHELDKLTYAQEMYNDVIKNAQVSGKEVYASYYRNLSNNGIKEIENLNNQSNAYKKLMDNLISLNGESAKESDKFKEYEKQYYSVNKQIREITVSIKEWDKAISELEIQKLGWYSDELAASINKSQNMISLYGAQGRFVNSNIYSSMIKDSERQIDYLEGQNLEYAKQQRYMDKNSEAYQEIENKIRSNNSAINELRISIEKYNDSITQIDLDKLIHEYDSLSVNAEEYNDVIKKYEVIGKEITSNLYEKLIGNGNQQIQNLIKQRSAYQALMDTLISNYGVTAKETEKYKQYEKQVNSLDSSIRDLTLSIIDWEKAVRELEIEKLAWQLDSLTASADRISGLMNLHAAQGIEETSNAYKNLINNGMEQIKILEKENELYLQQQKSMDKNSSAYQELQGKINGNLSTIESIKKSQEEWNDAIVDLGISNIQKYKDALSKTNDEYKRQKELQDSIQELEKIATQRKVRTYIEGEGFVYQTDADELRNAQEKLEDVISNQLMDRLDNLIDALEESKKDTNVYDANGNLLGQVYNTPNIGALTDVLSSYMNKNIPILNIDVLKDSLGKQFAASVGNSSNNNTSLNIGDIIINEAKDGNELAQAIVDQFPNALLQALYRK